MEILWCSLLLIFSIFFILKHLSSQNSRNLPPTPPALPVLGHLHHLKTSPHRALQALSKNYGPIIYLYFGCRGILHVSSPSAVEQCFTKNDNIFANRPESLASKILGYNHTTLGFSPYGDHWRFLRRLTTVKIFSSASLQRFASIRTEETRFLVEKLLQGSVNGTWRKVNLKSLFSELVYNVMMMMVTGKLWSMEDYEIFGAGNIMDICDYIPLLRWWDSEGWKRN
ncbi:Cytochrome [Forsythia ovata]|uniref:Cytochrome n=1 Tax=Forsythia ovata TaxID=205694 RepID=A0ABD1VLC8_9LAMI